MHIKRFAAWFLIAVLLSGLAAGARAARAAPPESKAQEKPTLPPAPEGHWAQKEFEGFVQMGILETYPSKPDAPLDRGNLAYLLVQSLGLNRELPLRPSFSDVPREHPLWAWIESARRAGLINGYPDGSFRPDGAITRAELAAMVSRAAWAVPVDRTGDVPPPAFEDIGDHWAREWIEAGQARNLFRGLSPTEFGPDRPTTLAEGVTIAGRLIQRSVVPTYLPTDAELLSVFRAWDDITRSSYRHPDRDWFQRYGGLATGELARSLPELYGEDSLESLRAMAGRGALYETLGIEIKVLERTQVFALVDVTIRSRLVVEARETVRSHQVRAYLRKEEGRWKLYS